MGKFVVTKRKNGEFQFNLKASNGRIIFTSEGYSSKSACMNGIESVKRNAKDDSTFEKLVSKNGKYYFNIKNTNNGEIIGVSEMYETVSSRNRGIESVKKNAPDAEVIEN